MIFDTLRQKEDNWETDIGAWFPGQRVTCRGEDLLTKFVGRRWMDLFLFGITGREFDDNAVLLFEQIWVLCSSFPEPRLWNNRIAALSGSAKSTPSLGVAAGIAATDARIYGVSPVVRAMEFLKYSSAYSEDEGELKRRVFKKMKSERVLPGYGRPIVNQDERIEPLMRSAAELGYADGHCVQLAFRIEDLLSESRYRIRMNIAALVAAFGADLELTCSQMQCWLSMAFNAGIVFGYLDGASKQEGTFFPLSCDRLSYEGVALRRWENRE